MNIYAKQVLMDGKLVADKTVCIENGMITAVLDGKVAPNKEVAYLAPGLVDLHCHGGEGFNARDCEIDGIAPFLEKMQASGVTDFLMTVSTGRKELMQHGVRLTKKAMEWQAYGKLGGARIRGVHLEGPFLSLKSAGAMQKSAMQAPSVAVFDDFFGEDIDVIREVTLAPEEAGADALIDYLVSKGIFVQAGHTAATFDEATAGFSHGITSLCHSFNGCRGIHHREPGVVVAALEDEHIYMEAICDLVHLHPAIIKLIYQMKGPQKTVVISDSTITNGLPNGEYHVEGYDIIVKDGVSRTFDGALDGGGAYLDRSVRNLVLIGIPANDALTMASTTPAARVGLSDVGKIAPDMRAHLVAFDEQLHPVMVVIDNDVKCYEGC